MMKICVLRLSSLGDTVLITPLLRELKSGIPEAHITLLVKEEYAPVFSENPNIDRLIEMRTRTVHQGIAGMMRFIRQLRGEEFDLFVDLHRNLRSRLIAFGVRSKRKMWYENRRWQRLAMVHAKWLHVQPRHTVDLYFHGLKPAGIQPRDRRPEIFLKRDETARARRVLQNCGALRDGGPVGIHVGAKGEAKRWFPERFARISDSLLERGWAPVLFGGEGDQQFLGEICRTARHRPTILHQTSLRELIALIDHCSAFVCHDSGPMHVAVARHIPVVALFGATHPILGFWPLGEHDTVLTADIPCSPCSLHGTRPCRKRVKECMEQISVDRVLEAVLHVLETKREKVEIGA